MRDGALVRLAHALLGLIGLTALAAVATPAAADGERALSVEVGWATFSAPAPAMGSAVPPTLSPDIGGELGVIYEHGVSTDFSLRGEIAGGLFYGGATKKESNTTLSGLADVGIVFRFDVLKYVPYAFGGVGAIDSHGGPIGGGAEAVLVVGGGLDILTSREHSYGFEARLASFGGDFTLLTVGVRGTMRWGFF
jgi:hypothetical protein